MTFIAHINFDIEVSAKSYSEAYFNALHQVEQCSDIDCDGIEIKIEKVNNSESKRDGALTVNVR